ncbi:response regulator, partial [Bradyrhizobium liaoningense]|uniref:response regulator n=1 Tax=Bradyrhizobium liaoningense TaxID=43992 RepID=UPI0024E05D7C
MLAPLRDPGPVENAAENPSVHSGLPRIRDSAGATTCAAHNILLVEDDPETRSSVVDLFEDHHFAVHAICRRHEISRYFACNHPDLLILDLQLGQDSDLNLLRELRSRFDVPIIATGDRCDEISCVIALELGADDYIAKPLGLRELSYAGFWVTRRSGGVVFRHLDDLDAVFESDTCADLRQL